MLNVRIFHVSLLNSLACPQLWVTQRGALGQVGCPLSPAQSLQVQAAFILLCWQVLARCCVSAMQKGLSGNASDNCSIVAG